MNTVYMYKIRNSSLESSKYSTSNRNLKRMKLELSLRLQISSCVFLLQSICSLEMEKDKSYAWKFSFHLGNHTFFFTLRVVVVSDMIVFDRDCTFLPSNLRFAGKEQAVGSYPASFEFVPMATNVQRLCHVSIQ